MRTHWVLALVAPFGLLACVRESRVAMRPADPLAVTRTVTRTETAMRPMKEAKEVQLTSLEVSEEIARICELPEAHFPFDSAEIGGGVQQALDKLAACFTEGQLAGRHMKVIGHADPRGTAEYNLGLGQRRASAVADYLMSKGLKDEKIESSSLGEYEATGKDEAGWSHDRRVEILLGEEAVILPKQPAPSGGGI